MKLLLDLMDRILVLLSKVREKERERERERESLFIGLVARVQQPKISDSDYNTRGMLLALL